MFIGLAPSVLIRNALFSLQLTNKPDKLERFFTAGLSRRSIMFASKAWHHSDASLSARLLALLTKIRRG
jgi:hypothetical protein